MGHAVKKQPVAAKTAQFMLKRINRDGVAVFWSRMGWGDIYGMALEKIEAEFRQKDMANTFPGIEIVPYSARVGR